MQTAPAPRPPWLLFGLTLIVGLAFVVWVDLRPHVDEDFFFAADNPEFEEDTALNRLFPSEHQILLSLPGDIFAEDYRTGIRTLSDSLAILPGVTGVLSLSHGPRGLQDALQSPLWSRILIAPESAGSQLIATVQGKGSGALIARVEEVLAQHRQAGQPIEMSGVPVIMELIRRHIVSDFTRFSLSALLLFGIAVSLIFRSFKIVLGTMCVCLAAIALTLLAQQALGLRIGVLSANVTTIVFVLTLSHIVFLSSNWRRLAREGSSLPVAAAVRRTVGASSWCMITTLLGFLSLLWASAKPLRELGVSGSLGTGIAFLCAFAMFPAVLRWTRRPPEGYARSDDSSDRWGQRGWGRALGIVALCVTAAIGLRWLNTDPSLLDYFPPGGEIYEGLRAVDRVGGSTPLSLVVHHPEHSLESNQGYEAMWQLHEALEADPAVGKALSVALLLAEAKRVPLAFMLSWKQLLVELEKPERGSLAQGYISKDRQQTLFWLRMYEAGRVEPREKIVARLLETVRAHDFQLTMQGGIYALQGQLAYLVKHSLVRGLFLLLGLFILIAFIACRRLRASLAMVLCLGVLPMGLLGIFGWLRVPLDIISLPAANVCLGIAVDAMLHLVSTVRHHHDAGASVWEAWTRARREQWRPILSASAIVMTGFGVFALSNFSPTVRFGMAVVVGTAGSAALCLWVLPLLGARGPRGPQA